MNYAGFCGMVKIKVKVKVKPACRQAGLRLRKWVLGCLLQEVGWLIGYTWGKR